MAAHAVLGAGGDPAFRESLGGNGRLLGSVLRVAPSGSYQVIANVASHETALNPAGGAIDSNPYGSGGAARPHGGGRCWWQLADRGGGQRSDNNVRNTARGSEWSVRADLRGGGAGWRPLRRYPHRIPFFVGAAQDLRWMCTWIGKGSVTSCKQGFPPGGRIG
jgi:hypothetical protein